MEKICWTDPARNGEVLQNVKEERKVLQPAKWRKTNWIGHILRRNCLLKHVMEGKIEGRMEIKGRLERRHKQLLDELRREKLLEFQRGSTRSLCMEHSLWKKLWTNRKKTDRMKLV
jgi:hypothetical protein